MTSQYVIFKSEEYKDPVTDEKLVILFCANRNEKVAFIVEDFLNFIFLELPDDITKKEFRKILKRISPDTEDDSWSFVKWEKYQGYPVKKCNFAILYGTDVRPLIADINNYFIAEGKKISSKMTKKELKRKYSCNQYYQNFNIVQKFSALTSLNIGDWFEITDYLIDEDYYNYCRIPCARIQQEQLKNIKPPSSDNFPIYTISCIDFEVNSNRKGKFPDPWEPKDLIYLTSYVWGPEGTHREKEGVLITTENVGINEIRDLKDSKPSLVHVHEKDEIGALKKLEEMIISTDPDFIFTYNGDSFDFPFWKARYDREGEELGNFGRLIDKYPIFKRNDWASTAVKSRGQELLVIPGRIVIDLFSIIRREKFYDLYTLKYVSEQILRNTDAINGQDIGAKDDLSAEEQFRIYREGTKEEWYRLLHYSLRDSFTPLRIIDKIGTVNNLFAMGRIIGLNLEEIYTRGQQHRLENKIFQDRIKAKVVIDSSPNKKFKKFKGAVVQPPLLKLMRNVAALDFQSLYPTIMIALNISHDTYIGMNLDELPDNLTEDDVNIIEIDENKKYYFIKSNIRVGTIPKLLVEFLDSRNAKKALMKKEKDEVIKSILDGEQLALKVIANSSYGFLGAVNGKLPLKEGAESVTAIGRKLITDVVETLRDEFQATIVYGDTDSVFFTFDRWQNLRGIDNIKKMIEEVGSLGKFITDKINLPPIKIVPDHFYTHYLVQTKKCYLANEVIPNYKGELEVSLSFRGVLNARREHCRWAKNLYSEVSTKAIGRASFDDDDYEDYQKKLICEEIILTHVMNLMQLRTPVEDLLKIVQMGSDYKNPSYPLNIFGIREKENGRPISPGERFRYWIVKGPEKAKVGEIMRRFLGPGEKINRFYYVDKLKTPLDRLMTGVFGDNKYYQKLSAQIKLKEKLLIVIIEEPYPHDIKFIRDKLKKIINN